ncbi:MAG: hypothetical protein KAJ14_11630, partial [Candidatus Omnitrophica bacterium]|nr:hypothetical protein [Candidatus Omnitrophota bacterium]
STYFRITQTILCITAVNFQPANFKNNQGTGKTGNKLRNLGHKPSATILLPFTFLLLVNIV